jgi:hypothetical protein
MQKLAPPPAIDIMVDGARAAGVKNSGAPTKAFLTHCRGLRRSASPDRKSVV